MRPSRRRARFLLLLAAMTFAGSDIAAQERAGRGPGQRAPVARVGDQSVPFPAGDRRLRLPVFADGDIAGAGDVERVVVVLHGTLRNADTYLDGMVAAVGEAAPAGRTLVIAPQFLAEPDGAAAAGGHRLADDLPLWTLEGWKEGAGAVAPAGLDPAAASSFAALDALLRHLADRGRFPALRRVIVAGHSAGGQVLARYAAAGRGDDALAAAGIAVRWVVANPSSYLYFDRRRPAADGGGFAEPAPGCAGFDRYKYGLEQPVPYLDGVPPDRLLARFLARDVVWLLGGSDDDPRHRFLDRTCAARLQGPHRLGRGQAYFAYLGLLARPATVGHRLAVVPGVGHDNRAMFGSPVGRQALFGDPPR
ncbi:hypothetical protein [Stella sp.]|uniref:hypothetical protein n=1 Tax=Stella sp. TaxID=2912054 RepID=UPI0035AD815E